jgi:hypothetical protein
MAQPGGSDVTIKTHGLFGCTVGRKVHDSGLSDFLYCLCMESSEADLQMANWVK